MVFSSLLNTLSSFLATTKGLSSLPCPSSLLFSWGLNNQLLVAAGPAPGITFHHILLPEKGVLRREKGYKNLDYCFQFQKHSRLQVEFWDNLDGCGNIFYRGRETFVEKSLPPLLNVSSQESTVQNYSRSLRPLSFENSKADFSKMDVCHKQDSHEILGSMTYLQSHQSSLSSQNIYFL